MTTERIDIVVREDGSRVVTVNINKIGDAAEQSAGGVDLLQRSLLTLASGATLVALVRLADQFTTMQNRLRLVTTGAENLAAVTKELGNIANSTRSDFFATTELYSRLATSSKELGVSQKQLLSFTKSLNQAIVLSGASAEEAAGGIRQLAQGMASGTLRGDELNSVLENMPAVADVIAKGLGVTRGELRKLGGEGKITARDIIQAFEAAKDTLEKDFGSTIPTVSQSITVLRNNFTLFIGNLDQSLGLTAGLAKLIMTLANNMNILIPIVAGLGAAIATAFAPAIIMQFASALRSLWIVVAANPFVALAAVIAGVVVSLTLLRDEIKLGIDDTTTLGDLMRAAWESIGPVIDTVRNAVDSFFTWLMGESGEASVTLIKNGEAVGRAQEATWLKVVRVVVQVFDMIGGTVRGVMRGVFNVISGVISAAINSFHQLGTAAAAALEGDWDTVINAAQSSKAGFDAGMDIAGNFSKGFQEEILAQQEAGLEATLDGWIKRAQEIGKERLKNQSTGEVSDKAGPFVSTPPKVDGKAAKELERLQNALDGVLSRTNPVRAAQIELAKAEEILNKAVAKGLITRDEANKALETYRFQLRDQLDPLGALNREMQENLRISQLLGAERETEIELMRAVQSLQEKGITLDKQQTEELRAQLVVQRELNRIGQAKEEILSQSSAGRADQFGVQTQALGQLRDAGQLTSSDVFNATQQSTGGLMGNSRDSIEAQLDMQNEYFANVQALRDEDLISEEAYQTAKLQLWANTQSIQLQQASGFFGTLATMSKSENKKLAAIGKAAAIAQTTIKTYESATSAYASLAGIPYVGPFLGAAAAAAAVVAGMANVQAIRSQNVTGFRTGGSMVVGGSGGPDSQHVAFRATPGERISVNTPAQARALERSAEEAMDDRRERRGNFSQTVVVQVQGKPDRQTPSQVARATRRATLKDYERS